MGLFMLDTNIASHVIKGTVPGVRQKLIGMPLGDICISCVSEGELRFGLAKVPNARKLTILVEQFLLRTAILAWDSDAASAYGPLRADLERMGRPLGALDTMIAAHAMAKGATLITADAAFRFVPGLKSENWAA
jgi:tRNA(fMet)-specific endonuclease VapC